jgi:hypothetical protein
MPSHRFHHTFVFVGVTVPIINRADTALLVILDAIHCIAAKPEPGDCRAVCAPQIVRCRALNLKLAAYRAHRCVAPTYRTAARPSKDEPGLRTLLCKFGNRRPRWFWYPNTVRSAVLSAWSPDARHRIARHFPPSVPDVLMPHVRDFAWPLAEQQDQFQR